MKIFPHRFVLASLFLFLFQCVSPAESLVHNNDCWVCLGDSITAEDIYPRILGRVFSHYHPEAKLTVINSGVAGDTASDKPEKLAARVLKYNPAIVSVMYGMNETINVWKAGRPKATVMEDYRRNLTYIARTLKEKGVTVILMSPTLTDPACGWCYFNLEGTVPFLRECASVVHDVAEKEGVIYIPVQEEMEAFAQTLPFGFSLRSDGVHVSALGQYQMARSIWERARFADPLGDGSNAPRAIQPPPPAVPATLMLQSRFLDPASKTLAFTINAQADMTVTATWSLGDMRKQETLNLKAGENPWTLDIPADHLPSRNGQNSDLLIDLRNDHGQSLFIVDLCRTQVLHFTDDVISGTVDSEKERPEGKRVANWQLKRVENGLLFSGEVFDSEINSANDWPFGRDGFNLMFDFRPTAHFAGIGVDRQVHQTLLNVYEKPFFAVALRAWSGANMGYAAIASGAKTPTGYTAQLYIKENFEMKTNPVNLAARDFVGILVEVNDLDTDPANPKRTTLTITPNQRNDYGVNLYANNLMIIDLKNKLPGDSVINVHLYPAAK